MSEEKKSRTIQEIQQEYQNLCARAGHLQYTIKCTAEDLHQVNEQLKDLNLEAVSAKEAPKQEEPKTEEVVNA